MRSAEAESQNTIELRPTAPENVAPNPDLGARAKKGGFEALFEMECSKTNHPCENEKNLLANHHRNRDAATPIRFTMLSCKRS